MSMSFTHAYSNLGDNKELNQKKV